jgi:hypothetical protein
MRVNTNIERKCANCGATAIKHCQYCRQCSARLPSAKSNRHPRTATGESRRAALARMLAGMRGPACVCGLHGPHECTRTREWKDALLSLLRRRLDK